MRRTILAALLLLLPGLAVGQDMIRYYPPAGLLPTANGYVASAPVLFDPGTVGAPGIAFSNNIDTGFYFTNDAILRWSLNGVQQFYLWGQILGWSSDDVAEIGNTSEATRRIYLRRGLFGSKIKALTESSATAAWDCDIAAGVNAGGTFRYCVYAADATDQQQRCADIRVSAVNKAGTTTCGIATVTGNATVNETTDANAAAISAGTLTYAVTCADTTNSFSLSFNAVSSLAQTTLRSESRLDFMTMTSCTSQ